MPTHKGVEVWIEDSEHRRLDYQEVTINLVDLDDRTMSVKTMMPRNEPYTVHCRSPTSIFCDIFVNVTSRARKNAARFFLDKSLTLSERVSGSSMDHTVEQFQDHGLRTPKRQYQPGSLGTVEVEIRRISEIIKGEPNEEHTANEDGVDFIMIDEPDQPPWVVFRFDINVKESSAVTPSTAPSIERPTRGRPPREMPMERNHTTGSSNVTRTSLDHCLYKSKKRRREYDLDRSSSIGQNQIDSDLLRKEYQKEQEEERRLLQKLQKQLRTKKTRNIELRKLLGETE